MNFDALFTNPNGRISRAEFVPALISLLAALAFFTFVVAGRTPQFCVLVLLYPAFVLLVQRLRDMAYSIWFMSVPAVLMVTNQIIQLNYFSLGNAIDGALYWVAPVVFLGFTLWACISSGKN